MWQRTWLLPAALVAAFSSLSGFGHAERGPDPPPALSEPATGAKPGLSMTDAVACLSVDKQGNYELLPGAALSNEEKLLVYYRPLNYQLDHDGTNYHIHLVQDGQIRARGEKTVLLSKRKMIDEDWKGRQPLQSVFLRNLVGLKKLPPGDYEFDIILHDLLAPGKPTARQSLPFRIVPAGLRNERGEVTP